MRQIVIPQQSQPHTDWVICQYVQEGEISYMSNFLYMHVVVIGLMPIPVKTAFNETRKTNAMYLYAVLP